MSNIREYSKVAGDNTGRYPENMQRDDLNNKLRDTEARIRTFAEELPWFEFSDSIAYLNATQFTVPGDVTSLLTVGDTVRAVGSTTGDIQGEITVSAYTTLTTVTVVWNSGQLENETLTVYVDVGGGNQAEVIVGQQITATSAPSLTTHQVTAQNDNVMFILDTTAGDIDLETPATGTISNGFYFRFKLKVATNVARITTPGSETIDDGVTWTIPKQYASGTIMWDGTDWWIVTLGRNGLSIAEVLESNIADGAVSTPKIADDGVTLAKLAHGTGDKVIGFDADGAPSEISNGAGISAARVKTCHLNGQAGGALSQCFATTSDEIWAVGDGTDNANGSHAGGTFSLPRRVSGFPTTKSVSKIVSGYRCHFILTTDGKVYAFGRNADGQLGLGDTTARDKAEQITALDGVVVTDVVTTSAESAGEQTTLFLTSTGTVWSCGADTYEQLGQGASPADKNTATLISGLTGVASIAISADLRPHCMTVQTDGTIRSWGFNGQGQLGLGDTTDRDTPQQPGGVTDVASVHLASGTNGGVNGGWSILLKTDGTVQACGENSQGVLGQGNTTDLSVFTTVTFSPAATIRSVSVAGGTSGVVVCIDDTDTMWSWGDNSFGQHGLGNTTDQTSPQKISHAFQGNVVDAKAVGSERYTGIVVRTASEAWAAGYGGNYNLCIGDAASQNDTFASVLGIDGNIQDFGCHGFAAGTGLTFLMTDGRMLTGGYGAGGHLGTGNTLSQGDLQPMKGFSQRASNALPNDRGTWATSTGYELGDLSSKAGPPIGHYICILAHTSSAATEPGVGASWATYWKLIGTVAMHVGNDTVTNITTNFAAASYTGYMAYVTNETGGAVPAFSDGTDWRRVTDRAVIS